jgi:tellurite resistance protein TerC
MDSESGPLWRTRRLRDVGLSACERARGASFWRIRGIMPEVLATALGADWLGKPAWAWLLFLGIVVFLLWLDLGVLHRKSEVLKAKDSFKLWAMFASFAIAFGVWIWIDQGATKGAEFFTGYVLETSLAFDNIFVISTIFAYFAVPREFQHRVLFWGIIGAIVFRAIFIGAGAAIIENFIWVLYIFAIFLIITGVKMATADSHGPNIGDNPAIKLARKMMPVTDKIESDRFFVKQKRPSDGKLVRYATPLFLALIAVEFIDIIFAIDSVPAIFAVTQDPYIVYTSNIFAILGLRSMYFMLAAAVERFKYLKFGLSIILVLIGLKIFWNFGLKDFGLDKTWGAEKLDPIIALTVTLSIIAGSILYSWWKTRGETKAQPLPAAAE